FLCLPTPPRSHAQSPLSLLTHTAPTQIYTLSLHDALPISAVFASLSRENTPRRSCRSSGTYSTRGREEALLRQGMGGLRRENGRSEEHTSELQSPDHLVCRLLLEKKKIK